MCRASLFRFAEPSRGLPRGFAGRCVAARSPVSLATGSMLAARLPRSLDALDARIAAWMARWGVRALRIAVGVVFVWFGALKLVPGLSPAEALVGATVPFDAGWFLPVLAVWEVLIGALLIIRPTARVALLLLALQMPGTFLPFLVLPELCFSAWPLASPADLFALTLEGQYIVKNLVLVSAALVVGGTVREASSPDRRL